MEPCYSPTYGRLRTVLATTLFATLLSGTTPALLAQPRAGDLLRSWRDAQEERVERVGPIRVDERARRIMDGASGTVESTFEAELSGIPHTRDWDRSVRSAELNGRPLPEERTRRLEEDFSRQFGLPLLQLAHAPERVLRNLDAPRAASESTLEGLPTWRLEFTGTAPPPGRRDRPPRSRRPPIDGPPHGWRRNGPPRDARPQIERFTLWLSRTDPPRLLRTRAILRAPFAAGPIIAVTDYTDFEGLDVPARVQIEGQVRRQRRTRAFTVLLDAVVEYENYRYLDGDDLR